VDLCLFHKVIGDKVYLLVVYVDDILVVAEWEELIKLNEGFMKEFRWITMVINNEQLYWGC
jgi:hypothetical protein